MKKFGVFLSAVGLAAGVANAQNLLSNGDFNLPGDGSPATGWTAWAWGGGWSNTEIAGWGSPGGTYHIAAGAAGDGGGGVFQTVAAIPGISYTLSVDSGADAWWLPTGTMSMIWLNDLDEILGDATRNTVDPAVYGEDQFDIPHPWESYSLSATAPAGATQVKVEFAANNATGSVGFDNTVLLVPEPTVAGLLTLGSLLLVGYRSRKTN